MEGPIGTIIDVLSVFATVVGVAVSLGMGALQINGGLHYLFGVPNNVLVQSIIIVVVTILFLASAWSGLSKGIQYLSNLNIGFRYCFNDYCFNCWTYCTYFKYVY